MSDKRYRNFATIVYPESAPSNWLQLLRDEHIPSFVSPLHDKDKNNNDTAKKPHYHVLVMFEGKKSVDQARDLFGVFGGVGCEIVQSLRGMARYLCHLDDPDKTFYPPCDVVEIAGADYEKFSNMKDNLLVLREIQDYIQSTHCPSFRFLFDFAANNEPSWYRVLCGRQMWVIREYLNSCRFEKKDSVTDDVPFVED